MSAISEDILSAFKRVPGLDFRQK